MKMAYILRVNGDKEEVKFERESASMEEIQKIVGGYFALIDLRNGTWAYVNEEGQLYGLPYNPVLTEMAHSRYGLIDMCGDALICETPLEAGFDSEDA